MNEKDRKLFITVTREFDDKFTSWAKRLGLTKSQFGNMCVQAGLNSLIQAVSPVEAFSPEQLVAIVEAAQKQGKQVDFSDFIQKEGMNEKKKQKEGAGLV
jgi:hypothetical protein